MTAVEVAIDSLTLEDIRTEQARRSLHAFVRQAWPVIESRPFVDNWHIGVLCDRLERITTSEAPCKVLVNIPPGTAKSLIVSVLWPAWELARDPAKRYLTASYAQNLATRDAVKTRVLLQSPWYRERWPDVELSDEQNQKIRYDTTAGGWRIATSVGGMGTGEHPDRIIIDDPHNAQEAASDLERQRAIDWFTQTVSTRGVTRGASIVVIMQRLHEQDLSGHILASEGAEDWTHICLPMRYEPGALPPTKACRPNVDIRTTPGELLWEALFPESRLRPLERDLGSYGTAGQLQQRPAPAEGGLIKRGWLQPYAETGRFEQIVLSWDTAMKDKTSNDYSVGQAWGVRGADRYLLTRERGRWDFPMLLDKMEALHAWARKHYPSAGITTLVENTAAGPDAIRVLRRTITGVIAVRAKGDKTQRVMASQPVLEAGNVFLPGRPNPHGDGIDPTSMPEWAQQVVDEWAAFPNAAHDDDVDAMTQTMLHLQGRGAPVAMTYVEDFA